MFVVYNKATVIIVKSKRHSSFKSLGAAKAHLTRIGKMGYRVEDHAVSEAVAFRNIEKMEERTKARIRMEWFKSMRMRLAASRRDWRVT